MKDKVYYTAELHVSDEGRDIVISPSEGYTGIILGIRESDEQKIYPNVYLNETEMELLIDKMRDMMNYVKD